jgi:hypothetical protein
MPQKTERFHINQLVNREERLAICSADCIVGEDVATGETEVVFGPEALEQEECTKVMIQLDLEAQLAYLGLVVTVLKGHWCYHGETFYGREAQPPASQVLCVDEQEGVSFHMPATQLAPGMVRLRDDATGEDCWVDRSDEDRPATADLHESFDPEDDRQKQMLWNLLFEENSPMIEYWEQALRDEPKESMSDELKETWLFMARCFRHLTGNADLSGNEKADILEVIGVTILNGEEYVTLTINPRTLTKERVREIAAFVDRAWIAWNERTCNNYKKIIDSTLTGEDMPTDDGSATAA